MIYTNVNIKSFVKQTPVRHINFSYSDPINFWRHLLYLNTLSEHSNGDTSH